MNTPYKMLYLVVEGLQLLKTTWQKELKELDEVRDDDRIGELQGDLKYLELTLAKYTEELDAFSKR